MVQNNLPSRTFWARGENFRLNSEPNLLSSQHMGTLERMEELLESVQACIQEENKQLSTSKTGTGAQKTLARKEALVEEVVAMSELLRTAPPSGQQKEYAALLEKIRKVLILAYENKDFLERQPSIKLPCVTAPQSSLSIYQTASS